MARALCATIAILTLSSIEPSHFLIASETPGNIVCRENVATEHRQKLARKLAKITGWPDLHFDRGGALRGARGTSRGGSTTAREFMLKVMRGPAVVVIEDASNSSEVAFGRVNPGRWKRDGSNNPPAFIVQLDFSDFDHVIGDQRALEAFDVGWGLLHELDHIVNDSHDATSAGESGECENHINQMRRECNLPERADYFYTPSPHKTDPVFITRLVRLAFEQDQTPPNKRKRYWLVWDANSVGGLSQQKEIASLR